MFAASQTGYFSSPMLGVRVMNWLLAILLIAVPGVLPGLLGRERYYKQAVTQGKDRFWRSFGAAIRNKALLILMLLALLKLLSNMIASSMDHYLFVYYMHDGDIAVGSYWKGILSTGYALMGFASIPAVAWLSGRIGKKGAILTLYALTVVAGFGKWMLFRPGTGWWILLDPLLSAPIMAGITMVIPSMMADVCDTDELSSGRRREGMFGAVFLWIQKAGVALAFFGTGLVLELAGFDTKLGGNQSPETFFWMRGMLAGVTSATAAVGFVVALLYPITSRAAAETRRLLEERRGKV
jgi:GPH family glycoside/pentoside/hexuronide:cation symporter